MKYAFFLLFALTTTACWADAQNPLISVKERLRLSLWVEGLEGEKRPLEASKKIPLPEELERALRKI